MLHTTFARAKKAGACIESYRKFAKYKGGVTKWGKDTPFPLSEVLEVCGLDDAIWCLCIVIEPADTEIRLFACDCAERALHIWEKKYPDDKRPRQAIETARKYAMGQATQHNLDAAGVAAWAAARAARVAAWAAVRAAGDAAGVAARAAGDAARAAGDAARAVTWDARDAEREWQKQRFLELLKRN